MPSMNLPGLSGTRYIGYFAQGGIDPTWFATASADKSEVRTNWFNALSGLNGYSWEYTGLFVPQLSGDYSFVGTTDDATVMWLGSAAEAGNFDTTNFLFSADATYFNTFATPVTLSAGVAYPIRIQWGHPIEPTAAILGLAYQYYNADLDETRGTYNDWSNVSFHEVPYDINFVTSPSSVAGPRGALLTLSCSAVASNGAPVTYNWFLSSEDYFTEGPKVLNLSQFLEVSENDLSETQVLNEYFKLIQSAFTADTNTLRLRNTDATLGFTQGRPLSSFAFTCVAFVPPEEAPKWPYSASYEGDFDVTNYPHTAPVSTSINSYPVYPDASPYYAINIGSVRPISAVPFSSENFYEIFNDVALFPGLIVFGSETEEASVALIGNPNILENNPVVIGVNSAEGYVGGNKLAYLSQLIDLSAGYISFTQNSNTATYSFDNSSFASFAMFLSADGPIEGTVSGMFGNTAPGALQLVQASPSDFNSFDPIKVSITSGVQQTEFERVTTLHGGVDNFLRKRLLGYY